MSEELEKKMKAQLDKCYAEIMEEVPKVELFGKTFVPIECLEELLIRILSVQAAIQLILPPDDTSPINPDRLRDLLRFILSTLQGNDSKIAISEQEGEQA